MEFYLNYQVWYLLICFFVAFAYVSFLYYLDFKSANYKNWSVYVLSIIRFITVFILTLLLLEPVLKHHNEKIEKPIIVFAQDNSESILLNKDSSYYKGNYKDSLKLLVKKLAASFDVNEFSFGSSVQPGFTFDYTDKVTNFGHLFTELNARYYGRNVGAVVIASDGILNTGSNPIYSNPGFNNIVFYAISLGDTSLQKDIAIQNVNHNRMVALGNSFPIEVQLLAKKMIHTNLKLTVLKNQEVLIDQELNVNNELETITLPFILEAEEAGKIKYDVKISETEGELTFQNNYYSFYVDVLDDIKKVLIIAEAPHPDIAALKWAINDNFNREIEISLLKDYNENLDEVDLIILHKLYEKASADVSSLIKKSRAAKIPVLHITGAQLDIDFFNNLNTGVEIDRHSGIIDAIPHVNNNFNSFIIGSEMKKQIEKYPPLKIPFAADYKIKNKSSVLIHQNLNGEITDYPLVAISENNNYREGLILGEGFWKWKMNEYLKNDNAEVFKSVFTKLIQFLISTNKKDRFIIDVDQAFNENEPIQFFGEIYNKNYELVNDADINLEIINDSGEVFNKVMVNNGRGYNLFINQLDPGKYLYSARTQLGDEEFTKKGSFNINEVRIEFLNSEADPVFLNQLVAPHNGVVFTPNNMQNIYDSILKRKDIVSISHHSNVFDDVVKWKWIFYLFITLLSIEWIFRKRIGMK